MKKLIAIAVVFALAAGGAFAVDLGGDVIGSVVIIQADSVKDSKVTSYGLFNRWRLEGSGENGDGTFGGWLRWESPWYSDDFGAEALVWWKPIDQFKLSIGGNSDGIYGKEGFAGWMFKQKANDTSVVKADQAWGGAYNLPWTSMSWESDYALTGDLNEFVIGDGGDAHRAVFRDAFFGGFGDVGLMLEIKPLDMIGVNVAIPFISMTGKPWSAKEPKDILKKIIAQVDLNFDFGNIALTYAGNSGNLSVAEIKEDNVGTGVLSTSIEAPRLYLYFGLSAIENLSLDVGVSYALAVKAAGYTWQQPLAVGLAAKYNISDAFGLKARVLAEFAGSFKEPGYSAYKFPFALIFELLPFFALNDNITIYADLGLNMKGEEKWGGVTFEKTRFGFHFNPYVQVGSEWGPSFFAGVNVYADGSKWGDGDGKMKINFEIPISLSVSF